MRGACSVTWCWSALVGSLRDGKTMWRCPDAGHCHHECKVACFRVLTCEPLSDVFGGDEWPRQLKALHEEAQHRGKGNPCEDVVPLRVGDVLDGYCAGYFGRDSYGEKIVMALGETWVTVREGKHAITANCDPRLLIEFRVEHAQ